MPTIQAVQAIGRVPLNPMIHGEMMKSTPIRAMSPSVAMTSGRYSDPMARSAVMTPSTTMVLVALLVLVVQIGDNAA